MKLSIPNLCFLTSSISLEFKTDGVITTLGPVDPERPNPDQILMLTLLHVGYFNLESVPAISLFDTVDLPDHYHTPEIYDGTQELQGKKILLIMQNGWGDMILIQPSLRAFYRKAAAGNPPRITIACNWIHNFPYPDSSYIHHLCPNIMTLTELCNFDILVNLVAANYQRSPLLSMRDVYLQIMKIEDKYGRHDVPVLLPNALRIEKIKPVLDNIQEKTGKKLLCVNWRSRFPHKNAPATLFFMITNGLSNEYQAVLFKDEENSRIMQKEIDELKMPVMNLSFLIKDYHDTTAALSLMDALISVDTGIIHAAGAMGIPGVALFGPFPPETHVADYASITAIRAPYKGENCEGPCLETHLGCAEAGYSPDVTSPCFLAIEVSEVLRALKDIMNRSQDIKNKKTKSNCLAQERSTRNTICVY